LKERVPKFLWTDKGKEFYNKNVDEILMQYNIKLYSTENEEKSSVVERWNRRIKQTMWKIFSEQSSSFYLDILPEILREYNNDYHSSIKMTLIQASKKKNEDRVYFNLYGDIIKINRKQNLKLVIPLGFQNIKKSL